MRKRISILLALVATMIFVAAGCGGSSVSAPVVDTVAPAPVTDVAAGIVFDSVHVGWSANSEADLAGYRVYRSQNGGVPTLMTTVTGAWYTDASVTTGVAYRYEIAAIDRSGNEGARAASTQVTLFSTGGNSRRRQVAD